MNHAPLNITKRTLTLMAIAASCPFAQAATEGYLSTSTAAGTSEVGPTAVYGGTSAQASIDTREKARRKAMTDEAKMLLQEGRTAYEAKKYKMALEKFQEAWKRIPKAPATVKWQEHIVECIGDASIAVSMEYAKIGRYDEAEQLLLEVLQRDPNNKLALRRLEELRDPVRNNPALTPEHVKNVEEVQRLLVLAQGQFGLGKFDEAYQTYNQVLRIDPYNTAARRGQEAVSQRRSRYYQSAHSSYRAQALAAVDALWEEPLPQETPTIEMGGSVAETISPNQLRNNENLMNMRISSVNLQEVPMAEALDFLRGEARKNNISLNFVFEAPKTPAPAAQATSPEDEDTIDDTVTADEVAVVQQPTEAIIPELKVQDISAKDLLEMMCNVSGCQYRVEDNAIVVYQTGSGEKMFRRQWKVPRSFFVDSESGEDEYLDEEEDMDGGFGSGGGAKRIDAKATLQNAGVNFRGDANAKYSTSTGMLTVYNTPDNLDAVEEAISAWRRKMPQMVKVSTKFIEVSQTNEEELSFDWVVNPFSINNSGNLYLGGVNGQGSSPNRTDSDFVTSGGSAFGNNYHGNGSWPISSGTAGSLTDANAPTTAGLMTGGNRSGSGALNVGKLDSLLTSGSRDAASNTSPAPGILSLTGIFDSGSYQMIMRGLSQKKGVDVMSAPSLVARPGELDYTPEPDPLASDQNGDNGCAKIEVVRRFIYASNYDPPEIDAGGNNNWGGNNDNNNWGGGGGMPIASPANPSEWAVEEVGIVMRFKVAELSEESDIIQFDQFEIKVVDFEGFINYGSPITAGITNQTKIEHITLTENRIDMPVFSRRYINSNPCIYDGYTIAIGGLIEDNVQKVEDSVPVFGDLPLVGRFFRSNAESHIRKNMIVFVTAEKIDPTGKPTRMRDKGTGDAPSTTAAPSLFPDDGLANP